MNFHEFIIFPILLAARLGLKDAQVKVWFQVSKLTFDLTFTKFR